MDRLEQLLQFEKESPKDSFIKYCLAMEYSKTGNSEKALEYYNWLLSHDEKYIATYYHLGKLYEELGRKDEAQNIYTAGLRFAQQIKDMHAYSELLNAKNELVNNYDVEFDN